jgi:hypothetical protein
MVLCKTSKQSLFKKKIKRIGDIEVLLFASVKKKKKKQS